MDRMDWTGFWRMVERGAHLQVVARGFILALADYDTPAGFPDADQVAAWRAEITRRQQYTGGGDVMGAPAWGEDHESLDRRVAADSALLDQQMPGWADQLDTTRLTSFEILDDALGHL